MSPLHFSEVANVASRGTTLAVDRRSSFIVLHPDLIESLSSYRSQTFILLASYWHPPGQPTQVQSFATRLRLWLHALLSMLHFFFIPSSQLFTACPHHRTPLTQNQEPQHYYHNTTNHPADQHKRSKATCKLNNYHMWILGAIYP